jgi:hypothetical protein
MKLNFCVACGSRDDLHHHHLAPRVEDGPDDESNLITLCEVCHGRIHGRTFLNHRKLQRAGITKAREAGTYKGRPATVNELRIRSHGLGATEIARIVGCKRGNIYKVLNRPLI